MTDKRVYILGISAFYHDSAAVILADGEIIAAAQEERFTRKRHDPSFPGRSVEYCLAEAGVGIGDIKVIAFYDKPFLKFERLIETYLAYAPFGLRSFLLAMPPWLKGKLFTKEQIKEKLGYSGVVIFPEHHHSHAASAFYPSPFEEAAVLTIDGVGEWATVSCGVGKDNHIIIEEEIRFPHSLGLLYSAFTYYCGFKVNSGEYKLMGLAPYGEPVYVEQIFDKLIDLKEDGSFHLDLSYFDYCTGFKMTSRKFHDLFGGPPRDPGNVITQRHMDLARSIQVVTEEVIMKMVRHVHMRTGQKDLCLAGGVALNCVANGRVLRDGPFDRVWIQPASSDAGGALGAAFVAWHEYLGAKRDIVPGKDRQKGSLLGPSFSDDEIEEYLKRENVTYLKLGGEALIQEVADLLAEENVVGWFQGKMEFGPRALGSRSILGDPRSDRMQSVINRRIKFRESFRPFAPTVLFEKSAEYFEMKCESPYMLLVSAIKEEKKISSDDHCRSGLDKLKVRRSEVPAITHVDYSARIQTVKREDNPLYYDLIKRFYEIQGCPLVINTSFNVRGEPIVCTPDDAYKCFMRTDMDYLVMGSFIMDKKGQDPSRMRPEEVEQFELD